MSNTLTPESRGRLVNLKTNLKSLQFGGDRPASGTSNQPYEVTPIPGGTGYLRDGCCNTDKNDRGVHTVCAKVTN